MSIVKPSRNAIIALDMQPPGRSMLTEILGHMGCELPEKATEAASPTPDTLPGDAMDPVARLNADLFTAARFDWLRSPSFPAEWFSTVEAHDFAVRAQDELAAAYGVSPLFGLTDPAVWSLLPFWHGVLMNSGCRVRHIVLHDHPAVFAASLQDEEACDAHYAQLLWLRQMLDAEAFSRRRPRLFLSRDRLTADWRAAVGRISDELGVEWPGAVNGAGWKIDQLAAAYQRHPRRDDGEEEARAGMSDEVRRTLDILDDWAANGENPADHAALDEIRAGLEAASFTETALSRQAQWLERRESKSQADHAAPLPPKGPDVVELEGRLAELMAAVADAKAELSSSGERHAAELAALKARAETAEAYGAKAAEDAAAPLRAIIERMRGEQAAFEAAIERKEEERSAAEHARSQLQSALTQRRHELEELYQREEQRETLIGQLRAALDQLKAENGELTKHQDDAGARLEQMARRLEAQMKREGAAHRERAEAEVVGQKRAEQIKALEGALESLRTASRISADQDRGRIETLTASLQSTEARLHGQTAEYNRAQNQLMRVRAEMEAQSLRGGREREELRQEIARLEATRDKIKNSMSWRYTAPIRKMVRVVRGRRNKNQ